MGAVDGPRADLLAGPVDLHRRIEPPAQIGQIVGGPSPNTTSSMRVVE
jgi:hypothetical protein